MRIVHLLQLCNPKELFLGLLEQIEQTSGEQVCQTIMLLLQPLQTGNIDCLVWFLTTKLIYLFIFLFIYLFIRLV